MKKLLLATIIGVAVILVAVAGSYTNPYAPIVPPAPAGLVQQDVVLISTLIPGSNINFVTNFTTNLYPNTYIRKFLTINGEAGGGGWSGLAESDLDMAGYMVTNTGGIAPDTSSTYDLGTMTKRWRSIYAADTIFCNDALTGVNSVSGGYVSAGYGDWAQPSYRFSGTTEGFFRPSAGNITTKGAMLFGSNITVSNKATINGVVSATNGSYTTPSYSFSGGNTEGLWRPSSGNVGIKGSVVISGAVTVTNNLSVLGTISGSMNGSSLVANSVATNKVDATFHSWVNSRGEVYAGTITNTSVYVNAGAMVPGRTPAEAQTIELGSYYLQADVYAFDSASDEYVNFYWTPPVRWDLGELEVIIHYFTRNSAGNYVKWQVQALSYQDQDYITSESFETSGDTGSDQVSGTDELQIAPTIDLDFTGFVQHGNPLVFLINRDTSIANNQADDALLMGVEIRYHLQ